MCRRQAGAPLKLNPLFPLGKQNGKAQTKYNILSMDNLAEETDAQLKESMP
jgi:hypothetical protein